MTPQGATLYSDTTYASDYPSYAGGTHSHWCCSLRAPRLPWRYLKETSGRIRRTVCSSSTMTPGSLCWRNWAAAFKSRKLGKRYRGSRRAPVHMNPSQIWHRWLHLLDSNHYCTNLTDISQKANKKLCKFNFAELIEGEIPAAEIQMFKGSQKELTVTSAACVSGQRAAVRSRLGSNSSQSGPASPALSSGPPPSPGLGSRPHHLLLKTIPPQSLNSMTSREVSGSSFRSLRAN